MYLNVLVRLNTFSTRTIIIPIVKLPMIIIHDNIYIKFTNILPSNYKKSVKPGTHLVS